MGKKSFQADQLIPTSATPPPEAGFFRIDRQTIGVDAKEPADQIAPTGTINEQKYWGWHNSSIRRSDAIVNAMRTAIGLTPAQMDQIFIAGSTMDP